MSIRSTVPGSLLPANVSFPENSPVCDAGGITHSTNVDIKHYFIDPPIHNIVMCPKTGVVLIDLDSKQLSSLFPKVKRLR
jgi:hypothetical protein